MPMLFFLVAFLSSIAGAICGIGGGVVIKPVLDMLQMGQPATINFLSGCTVLSMSLYSVSKALCSGDSRVNLAISTPLALGAAMGGVAGKELFTAVKNYFDGSPMVGGVQAVFLGIITLGTLIYTLKKNKIRTHRTESKVHCVLIGFLLGVLSSFLGIGGGPINLVVLGFCFSVDTKTAAENSLYIILFSQIASLTATVITGSIPVFQGVTLLQMVAGGIGGGVVGRSLNRKMSNRAVDRLFIGLIGLIVVICIYNAVRAFASC